MCTNTISVGYDGNIYDCDFNQQLSFNITHSRQKQLANMQNVEGEGNEVNVFNIKHLEELHSFNIVSDSHCFGCTAGMGSSWQVIPVEMKIDENRRIYPLFMQSCFIQILKLFLLSQICICIYIYKVYICLLHSNS